MINNKYRGKYEDMQKQVKTRVLNILFIAFSVGLTALLLRYILIVGVHNYASGDDYWNGGYTHYGWINDGLIGALKGSFRTVKEIYANWQGTWFSLFLFTLSPQIFNPHWYILTVFFALIGFFFIIYSIARGFLSKEYNFSITSITCIVFCIFNLSIQYVPRTTIGIFSYNGIIHYTLGLLIAFVSFCLSKDIMQYKGNIKGGCLRVVVFFLLMLALGGSNYLAAIVGLFGVFYEIVVGTLDNLKTNEKKFMRVKSCIITFLGIVFELIGLFISYKSPGNDIRANDDMSFRPKYFVKCIFWSVDRGRTDLIKYFQEKPILVVYVLIIVLIVGIELLKHFMVSESYCRIIEHPILACVFANGAHLAAYMPEVYSHSDVSGGVPNTHYWLILFVLLVDIIIIEDLVFWNVCRLRYRRREKHINTKKVIIAEYAIVWLAVIAVTFIVETGNTKTTNDYCKEYIESGRMFEYERVWWAQYEILSNPDIVDAIVPEYYEDVYPLVHMTMMSDSKFWQNEHKARYYGKNTIVAYDYKEGIK